MKDEDWVDAVERKLRPPREYVSADEYSKRVKKMFAKKYQPYEIGFVSKGNKKMEDLTPEELDKVLNKLKNNKAHGTDGIPAEYWKTIILVNSTAAQWALDFCRTCWQRKAVPEQWKEARVATIFKK